MTAATLTPTLGHQPIGNFSTSVEVAQSASGYVPTTTPGTIVTPLDPYWGGGEVIRLRVPANTTAIPVGGVAIYNNTFTYAIAPNTANLGQPLAVAVNAVPLNAGFDQYAWFFVSGTFPVSASASVAANTATGITAAGQLGANSAGKQVLNARVQAPATTTVVKANSNTMAGSSMLRVPNSDGWFVGVFLSGLGIPAATTISAIDASGTLITMSNAATATGSISATGTYNNGAVFYNVVTGQRIFAQGAIT
jgi:hypothetical protein